MSFLRSFIAVLVYPFFTLLCSALAILLASLNFKKNIINRIIHFWGKGSLKMFGVNVTIKNPENIPQEGCLFLFNHTSFFDVFALSYIVPNIRFGAKIELFKIPLFGLAMKKVGILPISRENRQKVIRVYQRAKERAKEGDQFALSPEGGRSESESLLPFKSGPFIFAIEAGLPIAPVVIKGAHKILPKGSLIPNATNWRSTIEMVFLPMIKTDGWSVDQRSDLQKIIYEQMQSEILK